MDPGSAAFQVVGFGVLGFLVAFVVFIAVFTIVVYRSVMRGERE